MNLQDFYDLGFKEIFKDTSAIRRRVLNTDEHYQEVQDYARTFKDDTSCSYWNTLRDFAWNNFKYMLQSISSQGGVLTEATCYFDDNNGERVIVKLDDIELEIYYNKDTKFVYKVYDRLYRFSSFNSYVSNDVYEVNSNESSILTLDDFMKNLLKSREQDAQNVRNYYNKQLKEIHQTYKSRLDERKSGINNIKKLIKKE